MRRATPVLVITGDAVVRYRSLTEASKVLGVSRYTLLGCYFTETALPDGSWIDLDLSVDPEQEQRLFSSWLYARRTSDKRRRRWDR